MQFIQLLAILDKTKKLRFKRKSRFEHHPSTMTGRLLKNKFFLTFFAVSLGTGLYSSYQSYKHRSDWIDTNKNNCKIFKSSFFKGVIDSTYNAQNNRYLFTAIIKSKDSTFSISSWYLDYPEAYFKKGDYVIKEPNSFEFKIVKPEKSSDTIRIKSDFDCNQWERHRD